MKRLALLLSAVLLCPSAWAQSRGASAVVVAPAPSDAAPVERASKLRDEGNAAMLAMRYADALGAYQRALDLVPDDVGVYYSIARARQFLGDYPGAFAALETFDTRASPEARAKVGKLDELYAEIRPRVATLDLTCSEAGARVLVRDRVVGTTPLAPMRLPSGASTIEVELDGFFAEKREAVLPGAGTLKLEIPMHRKSSSGVLAISSDPIGSNVVVDGRYVGTTSPRLELALNAGPHDVVVHHEGYDDAKVPLMLAPGATRDVAVPLERSRAVTSRWWFWTSVGVAVAGGVVLTYALTTEKAAGRGSLSPGQVGGP